MEEKHLNIFEKIFKKFPIFFRWRNHNPGTKYESLKNNFRNFNFMVSLFFSILTIIFYQVKFFTTNENLSFIIELKNKIFIFSLFFDFLFFILVLFLCFTKRRKLRLCLTSLILILQESYNFLMFAIMNNIVKNQGDIILSADNDKNMNNDLISIKKIEIFRFFFIFYISQTLCYALFDLKFTNLYLSEKLNAFLIFIFYKMIVFFIMIFLNTITNDYKYFLREILLFILTSLICVFRYFSM